MKKHDYVKEYAQHFNYKLVHHGEKRIFIKSVNKEDFVVIESCSGSKYVNFYLNHSAKTFKKSDLFLGIMENSPVAWEVEGV